MYSVKSVLIIGLIVFSLLAGCQSGDNKKNVQPDFSQMIQPVPEYSILEHEDYWVWGASMVRTEDGVCHLFYSRWSKEYEFKDWIFRSEIAYATATQPGGPYQYQKTILKGRGENYWDECMAHNPHIKKFGDRYYLYFISYKKQDLGMDERMNCIFSQRIGVAESTSPEGPWKICDTPLVDLQEGKAAHGYVTNPSVCQKPDGSFLMLFKSRDANWKESAEFRAIHCVAESPSPTGPFVIHEKPILTESTAEDPFLWYQNDRYYAIVDDQYGNYLGEKGLALFESPDGVNWGPSAHILVSKVQIKWENGTTTPLNHLERPQLWFNEKGEPSILFCAAQMKDETAKHAMRSFNVHIPLK